MKEGSGSIVVGSTWAHLFLKLSKAALSSRCLDPRSDLRIGSLTLDQSIRAKRIG